MRVFTWNLFVGPPCGSASLEKQLEYLAEQDADILCLQEVYAEGTLRRILEMFPAHKAHYRRRLWPLSLWLCTFLLFLPPPLPLVPLLMFFLWACVGRSATFQFLLGGVGGTVLLSKYTILRKGWGYLPPRGIDYFHQRAFLWAEVVGDTPMCLLGVHFSLDTEILEESLRRVMEGRGTVLLLGDTNAGREKMAPLERKWNLKWLETGPTWVRRNPMTKGFFSLPDHVSDVILVRGLEGEAWTSEVYISDHLPVFGEIT